MPRQSEHRTQFLKLAEEFFYASAVPPHDPDDPDADDLAVAFELEGIQFELTHRGVANDPISGLVFVHTVVGTLPEEPRQEESMLREALLASHRTMRTFSGAFTLDANTRELLFLSAHPLERLDVQETIPAMREFARGMHSWRDHALSNS